MIPLPKTTISYLNGGGGWALSIKMEACVLWGMPVELGMFIQKGGGVKAWALYLGFKMEANTRSTKQDSSQTATDKIKKIMGEPIRRLGFAMASKNMRTVRAGSTLNLKGTEFQKRLPFMVDDIWPGPQIYTEADLSSPSAGDSVIGKMGGMNKAIAGSSDPNAKPQTLGSTVAKKCTAESKKRSVFVIPISATPEICLGLDFRPDDGGIPIGDEVMFTGLVLQGCVKLAPPGIKLSIEASADIKVQADLDIPVTEKFITMQATIGLELELTVTALTLKAFFMAKLKSTSQIWHNPFGIMPKMGVIFPLGAGIGFSLSLQTMIPAPTYFEIEAGFVGCASKIYSTDDDAAEGATLSAQAALGRQNADHSSQMIPFGQQRDVNGNAMTAPKSGGPRRDVTGAVMTPAKLGEKSDSIPGLEKIYCGTADDGFEDPYGKEPTVFKIAIIADIAAAQFGVLVVMRNIFPVRLILMMFPFIPAPMRTALVAMRGILDMVTVERFDVSLNPMPFPMVTRGGTEIPHGLKLDIINFVFFKIITVRRVFLHVTFLPPGMECHIFIDPFAFKIAGTTIFSLTGLEAGGRPLFSSTQAVVVTHPRVTLSNRLGDNHAPDVSHKVCLR